MTIFQNNFKIYGSRMAYRSKTWSLGSLNKAYKEHFEMVFRTIYNFTIWPKMTK